MDRFAGALGSALDLGWSFLGRLDWYLLGTIVIKIALAIVALVVLSWLALKILRCLDDRNGIDFGKSYEKMRESALALAHYHGERFKGVMWAIAVVLAAALMSCFAFVAVLPVGTAEAGMLPSKYDRQIRQAAERHMRACGSSWHYYWSQLYVESRHNESAVSPVGAEGIAQFMPGTAARIFPLLGYKAVDRRLAGPSIEAGALYMGQLCAEWSAPRPPEDRHKLACASYNAGLGHILAAQRACEGAALYDQIMQCLPAITGMHARETLSYAPSVWLWARRKMAL